MTCRSRVTVGTPILDYPGWDDDRYCPAVLFGYADGEGQRASYHSLRLIMQELTQWFGRRDTEIAFGTNSLGA